MAAVGSAMPTTSKSGLFSIRSRCARPMTPAPINAMRQRRLVVVIALSDLERLERPRMEQLVDLDDARRDALRVVVTGEGAEHVPVRLDAVRPEVGAHHRV